MDYNTQAFPNTAGQPNDYKTWSIINLVVSILFCCSCTGLISLVLSIIALVKSNDVSKYMMAGETGLMQAQEASKTAKTLNLISSILLGIGFAFSIIYIVIYGLAGILDALDY